MDTAISEAESLLALDATAQAEVLRSGEVTASELAELSSARIRQLNPELNAVIYLDETATNDAGQSAPFAGVPMLLKDLGNAAVGHPDHQGSLARKNAKVTFDYDCSLVRRFRSAGFVPLGRTNTAEFGLYSDTNNDAYGQTRNPWNPALSAGGSSGGAAAAVASAMVAVGQGTDGGGSIRNPAAHCGLVGLKVSRGLLSSAPEGESMFGISQSGVLTRSVRDTAAIIDLLKGTEPGDPTTAANGGLSFVNEALAERKGLRIGFLNHDPAGIYEVDPEIRNSVKEAASLLGELGHEVDESWPKAMFESEFSDNWFSVLAPFVDLARQEERRLSGPDWPSGAITDYWAEYGERQTATEQLQATLWLDRFRRRMAAWFEHHDVLLCPVLALLPQPTGRFSENDGVAESISILRFTPQINVAGIPAITVPVGFTQGGIPLAVQLVGKHGTDHVLLDLATQFEQAQPWRTSTLAAQC